MYKQTQEHKQKISLANKGKNKPTFSQQHIEKIRLARIGTKHSEETKNKMSSALKGKYTGDKSKNWKGGVSSSNGVLKVKKLADREKLAGRPKPEQCEICGAFGKDSKNGICFDHDHKNNKFRGWLCSRCNIVLGFVKDNAELLDDLSKYLRSFNK